MKRPRLKAVTLDFWNTMFIEVALSITNRRADLMLAGLKPFKHSLELNQVTLAIHDTWKMHRNYWKNGQVLPIEAATKNITKLLSMHGSPEVNEIIKLSLEYMIPSEELVPCGNLITLLQRIKSTGLCVGIISDTGFSPGSLLWERLHSLSLTQYFDGASFSDEVGAVKPSSAIFLHSLAYLKAEPHEVMHVGDLWLNDIQGAQLAGFRTIRFTGVHDDKPRGNEAEYVASTYEQIGERIVAVSLSD